MGHLPDEFLQELMKELEDAAEHHARAKNRRVYLTEFRKVVKAQLMNLAESMGHKAVQAREQFAYSHPTYLDHLTAQAQAEENEALMGYRWKRAEINWEAWRSINANQRTVTR